MNLVSVLRLNEINTDKSTQDKVKVLSDKFDSSIKELYYETIGELMYLKRRNTLSKYREIITDTIKSLKQIISEAPENIKSLNKEEYDELLLDGQWTLALLDFTYNLRTMRTSSQLLGQLNSLIEGNLSLEIKNFDVDYKSGIIIVNPQGDLFSTRTQKPSSLDYKLNIGNINQVLTFIGKIIVDVYPLGVRVSTLGDDFIKNIENFSNFRLEDSLHVKQSDNFRLYKNLEIVPDQLIIYLSDEVMYILNEYDQCKLVSVE